MQDVKTYLFYSIVECCHLLVMLILLKVPDPLEVAVSQAIADILADLGGQGQLFLSLYYRVLRQSMKVGRDAIMKSLQAIASSAGLRG